MSPSASRRCQVLAVAAVSECRPMPFWGDVSRSRQTATLDLFVPKEPPQLTGLLQYRSGLRKQSAYVPARPWLSTPVVTHFVTHRAGVTEVVDTGRSGAEDCYVADGKNLARRRRRN